MIRIKFGKDKLIILTELLKFLKSFIDLIKIFTS